MLYVFSTNVHGLNLSMGKKLEPTEITEIVNKLKRKPNILWVDQGRERYNSLR